MNLSMTELKTRARTILRQCVEWLLRTFYIFLRKFGQRGLVVAIILVSIPLALNISCIIIFLLHIVAPGLFFKAGFLGTGGLAFLNYGLIDAYLEGEYLKRKRKLEGAYYLVYYLFAPLYFAGSVYMFIYFFRFL